MLELLKKAEEGVKEFNNLPEEQRYYYDPDDKYVIHVTKLSRIETEQTVCYKFKGHDIDDEDHCWFNFFYNTFKFVTKEEAMKQAETAKSKQRRKIKELEYTIAQLQRELTDLKEECDRYEDTNCKA